MSSKNTQKLNSISFLRFFAFLNIFLYHSSEFEVFSMPYNAAWAVGFFFILSGFLAGFWHEKIESPLKFSYWKNYIIRKFRKIYPFFLVTMILTLPYGRNEGIFQLFINLFLLQSWRPEGYFSYNGVTWFLSTIFFLYVITVPVISLNHSILNKIKKKTSFLVLEIVFFLMIDIIWASFVRSNAMSLEFYTYILPLSRIPEYICGISCGILFKELNFADFKKSYLQSSIFEIVSFSLLIVIIQLNFPEWMHRSFIWIVPNLILIMIFAMQGGVLSKIFSKKIPVMLGDISFECFLLHQILLHYYCDGVHYLERRNYYFNTIQKIGSQIFLLLLTVFLAYIWHYRIYPSLIGFIHKKRHTD